MTRKGVVLLSVVIILLTIAIIGASLVIFFSSVNIGAQTVADEMKALYLGEAGISHAIYLLRNRADAIGQLDESFGPVALGDGTYTVKVDFSQSLITSTGSVNGVDKTVQLQYTAL